MNFVPFFTIIFIVLYILNKYHKIDVIINNAGISQSKLFMDITDNDWNTIINTNLL